MPKRRAISAIGGCRFGRSLLRPGRRLLHEGVGSFHRPNREVLPAAQPAGEFRIAQRELAKRRLADAVTQAKPFHVPDQADACRGQVIDAAHELSLKGSIRIRQRRRVTAPYWRRPTICGIYPVVTLRDRLKTRMLARGFTVIMLANAAGVKPTFVRDILRGRVTNPQLGSVARLAAALYCSVEDLYRPDLPGEPTQYDARTIALAELNAKLRHLSIHDLQTVIRLIDAVHPGGSADEQNNNAA